MRKCSFSPVGRVQFINMYPCTFYEFLCALDKELLASRLLEPPTQLPDAVHQSLLLEYGNISSPTPFLETRNNQEL